jgi:uncharacterized protein YfbU (UPF0304 family)
MKKIKQLLTISTLTILSVSNVLGQTDELTKFFDAYKTSEFDESKKIIQDYSFDLKASNIMSEYGKISGLLFETDNPEVKGYKAIVTCKLENKSNQIIDKRMMVVMYFDKTRNHWAVFEFREVVDVMNEYNSAKSDLEINRFHVPKKTLYGSVAYWSMMVGKLQDAKKYSALNIEEAKSNNLPYSTNIDSILKVIQ